MAAKSCSVAKRVHGFQEALTRLALVRNGIAEERISWGRTLAGGDAEGGIDTDLVVGDNPEHPEQVIQVRHSGSSKEQEKKFWRAIHELTAVKALHSPAPVAVSVIFDDALKEGLYRAEVAAFDAVLRLPDAMYGRVLIDWCRSLTRSRLASTGGAIAARKRQAYRLLDELTTPGNPAYEPELHEALDEYRKVLGRVLTRTKAATKPLWQGARAVLTRPVAEGTASGEPTFIKRGLAKLLIFEEPVRDAIVAAVLRRDYLPGAPGYAEALGLTESLSHGERTVTRVEDADLINAVRKLGKERVRVALADAPLQRLEAQYLQPIRELAISGQVLDALARRGRQLSSPKGMLRLLDACARDPAEAARSLGVATRTTRNWLIDGVMALARAHSDLRQGYGYPRLAEDCAAPEFATLPGLTVSQYASRRLPIPDAHRRKLAAGLSKRLAAVLPKLRTPPVSLGVQQATHILETRLIPYRLFDPVGSLVRLALSECPGVAVRCVPRHPTALSEYAGVRAATTKLLLAGRDSSPPVAIAWQSANKNPRDKQKEFCGRIAMLRQTWDAERRRFRRRPFRACLFVADGAWTAGQRKELIRYGFDAVLLPTELGPLRDYLQ
jgi:hypothetical protein